MRKKGYCNVTQNVYLSTHRLFISLWIPFRSWKSKYDADMHSNDIKNQVSLPTHCLLMLLWIPFRSWKKKMWCWNALNDINNCRFIHQLNILVVGNWSIGYVIKKFIRHCYLQILQIRSNFHKNVVLTSIIITCWTFPSSKLRFNYGHESPHWHSNFTSHIE